MLHAVAQLYVYGHDLDFRTLFGKGECANIPRTKFKRKPHWLDARFNRRQFGGDAGQPRRAARRPACLGVRAQGRVPISPRW